MATIRKRNDKFQVQVRIRGHSKSATFLTLKHARHWGRQKELEFEKSFQLGELYRPKHFLEVLQLYCIKFIQNLLFFISFLKSM